MDGDVDALYDRIRELSAAVERLEAENERLREELAASDASARGGADPAKRSDGDAGSGVFASFRRRFGSSN